MATVAWVRARWALDANGPASRARWARSAAWSGTGADLAHRRPSLDVGGGSGLPPTEGGATSVPNRSGSRANTCDTPSGPAVSA